MNSEGVGRNAADSQAEAGRRTAGPELKQYIGILRRRIWAVLTAFVIVVTLGTVHAFKATPMFLGQAKVLIEKQTPHVMDFEDVVELEVRDRNYYRTQEELLRSRTVLEKALEAPGMRELFEADAGGTATSSLLSEIRRTVSALLGTPPARPPEPWQRLRTVISVEQMRNTHLLAISVENPDAACAARIANAVAGSFQRYHLERKLAVSNEAFAFLQDQTEEQQQKLIEAENTLQRFREQVKIVSLNVGDAGNPVLVRLSRLNAELTEAQLSRIALEAELKVVEEAVSADDEDLLSGNESLLSLPQVRADPTVAAIRAGLVNAEKEVMALADTYGPDHPQLRAAEARVDLLRSKLREALGQIASSLAPQLETLGGREQELQGQYETQNQLALELARHSLIYGRLQNEVARHRRLFDVLVERMREVDLTTGYTKTNVEVVEAAEIARLPIRPRKVRLVVTSVILGLLLGIALAFFFEYMDDTIKTPEDLEDRVGVPVLGFVPAMNTKGTGAESFAHRGMVSTLEPTSSVTEAYRNIRTSLFFSAPPEEARALVITSGGPGDGKTTTAANLALVIAQSGKRVLLVDADFRRPMLHNVFRIRSRTGATTVLVGEATLEEAVRQPSNNGKPIDNLDVLIAGPKPPNPAELLDSERMRQLLEEARQKYDRVLLDTPPVLFVADASILGALSDGVIMVVKSAKNTRSLATRAREQLEGVNARILGGILNDVRVSHLGYYYSDYYYHGYSRYYRDYDSSYYSGKGGGR